MADVLKGKLVVISTKNKSDNGLRVTFPTKKGGMSNPTLIPKDQLHPELIKKAVAELNQLDIELELEGGQPRRIRAVGATWSEPLAAQNDTEQEGEMGDFHNPYNFIPAPPRKIDHPDLGDRSPVSHGVYHSDRWSGHITITLRTVTPLLIPDAARALPVQGAVDHKSYPIRIDANDKPYLPPTSIKGMLRSAYEAVTNSRLSVFKGHNEKLVYRMVAKEIGLIPARVERNKNDTLKLHLMQVVKLPRYPSALRYNSTAETSSHSNRPISRAELNMRTPQHGDPVWVKHNAKKVVTDIQKRNLESSDPPDYDWKEGWVWVANQNIEGKKYERVFIESDDDIDDIQIDANIEAMWKDLIQNYKNEKLNIKGLKKRHAENVDYSAYLDRKPAEPAFSRHIYEPDSEKLQEGTLCYVELDSNEEVKALLPVTLSRHFYQKSPEDLLDEHLKPSTGIDKLSPADRVFGWVRQNKDEKTSSANGAYKGQLRIGQAICQRNDAVENFGDVGFPLAILGQPQPQQARFYAAKDKSGNPFAENTNKDDTYHDSSQGLRGRKVYPHHKDLPETYWDDPTINAGQEYRRPEFIKDGQDKTRDDQNRSIQAWVKRQTEFKFSIDVTNLSSVELGALLWLLSLPDNHYHRLGGGKPLGFGSIRLDINWQETDLRLGDEWRNFYLSLVDTPKPHQNLEQVLQQQCVQAFQTEAKQAYSSPNFEQIPFIAAFIQSAKGFDDNLPIHYPRLEANPQPEGKSFEWFVGNESAAKKDGGRKVSLPKLVSDRGLPRNPKA